MSLWIPEHAAPERIERNCARRRTEARRRYVRRTARMVLLLWLALLASCSNRCSERIPGEEAGGSDEGRQVGVIGEISSRRQNDRQPSTDSSDAVIARVNQHNIYRSELEAQLQRSLQPYHRGTRRELSVDFRNSQRRRIAHRLVEDEILAQVLDEEGIQVGDAELEQAVEAEISSVFGSEERWLRYLERRGIDRRQYTERKCFEMRLHRLLTERGLSEPTEEEVLQYYQRYRERWRAPERVRAAAITIRLDRDPSPEERLNALERLEALREGILQGGQDFETVAREHSETPDRYRGGDMGWVYRDDVDLEPAVAAVLFDLEVGEVSDPVRTRLGYQIFRISDRRPEGFREFEEVRDDLYQRVHHRAEGAARAAMLRELGGRYNVVYFEEAYGLEEEVGEEQ